MDWLSVAELLVFEKLVEKVTASEDGPELYHEDVVEVILEAAREGQLPTDVSDIFDSRSLLENPVVDAEAIEDWGSGLSVELATAEELLAWGTGKGRGCLGPVAPVSLTRLTLRWSSHN